MTTVLEIVGLGVVSLVVMMVWSIPGGGIVEVRGVLPACREPDRECRSRGVGAGEP